MSADITPDEARNCDDKLLTRLANQYRVGSGAHTVVQNEINRRANKWKTIHGWLALLLKAWPIILVPIGIWAYSKFFG